MFTCGPHNRPQIASVQCLGKNTTIEWVGRKKRATNGGRDMARACFECAKCIWAGSLALSHWGETGGTVVAEERQGNTDVRG